MSTKRGELHQTDNGLVRGRLRRIGRVPGDGLARVGQEPGDFGRFLRRIPYADRRREGRRGNRYSHTLRLSGSGSVSVRTSRAVSE